MYRVCEDSPDIIRIVKPRIHSNGMAFSFKNTSFNICTHTFTVKFEKIKCHLFFHVYTMFIKQSSLVKFRYFTL